MGGVVPRYRRVVLIMSLMALGFPGFSEDASYGYCMVSTMTDAFTDEGNLPHSRLRQRR